MNINHRVITQVMNSIYDHIYYSVHEQTQSYERDQAWRHVRVSVRNLVWNQNREHVLEELEDTYKNG